MVFPDMPPWRRSCRSIARRSGLGERAGDPKPDIAEALLGLDSLAVGTADTLDAIDGPSPQDIFRRAGRLLFASACCSSMAMPRGIFFAAFPGISQHVKQAE